MATDSSNESKTTPVYVPYATLISSLDALRNHGIPASGRIDKTIWESQSGSIRGQLILAYKFLGLINQQNQVLPALPPLVSATNPAERKPILKKIVEDKYREIISLGLTTISPGQLNDAFAKFGINGSTLKAATRFLVKACTELDIPIAKRFSDKTRATGPRKKRGPNGAKRNDVGSNDTPAPTPPAVVMTPVAWEAQLLAKFPEFDPSWPEPLKAKWFEGFDRLMGVKPGQK